MQTPADAAKPALTVFYDGACPLCSREIAWYRRRQASQTIAWVDLRQCLPQALPQGLSCEVALARFHVVEAEGRKLSGAAAFTRLWLCYPGLAGFARLAGAPVIANLLEWGYHRFLPLRPTLARWIPAAKT